ncbi:two-component sensor histidine kinase [Sphingomonas jinjuensis]|uniref:histidine kinase n=1 Tax=Sphingomonas jinjuensis TaxID=535907 RepID=A0A840F933_9SPHN|nr:histidine kinase dimerization/phosphoacceptor domain -containing protein [Sphingomonas jinjuensis]MBB4154480.1 two-component sensor histidine kinase [Sphingomonas jinjuensis]
MATAPSSPTPASQTAPALSFARLTTGAKLFLILSAALLPLALIAVIATLQTSRLADAEARARLRVAANESARSISIELIGDMTALRAAVNALAQDPADAPSCARVQGVFAQQASIGTRFSILDRQGRSLCGDPGVAAATINRGEPIGSTIIANRGLILEVPGGRGSPSARVFFPRAFLAQLGSPESKAVPISSALVDGTDQLQLSAIDGLGPLDRVESIEADLGVGGLKLRTSTRSAPITSSLVIALMLPLVMWALAAGIGWFVVDRMLIRPLQRLRTSVARFTPGDEIDVGAARAMPAQEIRELGDTFRAISRTVALHEAGLAEGLVRQTKLTREVHHRVKNNLQVISSLINFHARGAPSGDATNAYASIQRRVDALAVVHRNHFAEMEENRGLNLRPVIGELASNIRATAPAGSSIGIALDIDPFLVNQDVGVAVAFLVTEGIELAMNVDPAAQVRVAIKPADGEKRAVLRLVSRAFVESDRLRELASTRYGRVMEGLSRQLRAPLHHDPLTGAYEIMLTVLGRD